MQIIRLIRPMFAASILAFASVASIAPAQAWTFKTLYEFTGHADGGHPNAGLLLSPATGDLYGVADSGGDANCNCGVLFKLAPDGTQAVLHAFKGAEGSYPRGALTEDASGNIYGTAQRGGVYDYGTLFKLSAGGAYKVLFTFTSQYPDIYPGPRLTWDPSS